MVTPGTVAASNSTAIAPVVSFQTSAGAGMKLLEEFLRKAVQVLAQVSDTPAPRQHGGAQAATARVQFDSHGP